MSVFPLVTDAAALGLQRRVVRTPVGEVVARTRRDGAGPATILLHGAAGSWTTWTPLLIASRVRGVEPRNPVAIDLPGWGESPGPVPDPAQLADAIAGVARALGYERWQIIGHSLGGAVALDVAARFADETVAVGLVSPSGAGVRDAVRRPVRGGLRLPGFAGMLLAMRGLRLLGPTAPHLLRGLRAIGMLRALARPLFRDPRAIDRSVTDALADEIRPAAFVAAARAARRHDDGGWSAIRCRVRSIRGARDVFARADDGARFAATIPRFCELVLGDAGHFAHVEQPLRVADLLFARSDPA